MGRGSAHTALMGTTGVVLPLLLTAALTLLLEGPLLARLPAHGRSVRHLAPVAEPRTGPAGYAGRHGVANVAYFIQVTTSTVWHVPRLVSRLYDEGNAIVVHFDTKVSAGDVADVMAETYARTPAARRNVRLLPPQVVTYAGYSMVLNTLAGIRELLDMHADGHPWDYLINISGSDYPLFSARAQRELLAPYVSMGVNFFRVCEPADWPTVVGQRVADFKVDEVFTGVNRSGKLWKTGVVHPFSESLSQPFEPAWSEAWMVVTRDFARFSVESDLARLIGLSFAFAKCSDELFFYTLAYNSEVFNRTVVYTGMRANYWDHEGEMSGPHPFNLDEKLEDGSYRFEAKLELAFQINGRKFQEPESEFMDVVDAIADDPKRITRSRRITWQISRDSMTRNGNFEALAAINSSMEAMYQYQSGRADLLEIP